MARQILVLGGTGMLGRPVVRALLERGFGVRLLVRDPERARRVFGDRVGIVPGDVTHRPDLGEAARGCDAVHVNLTQDVELVAVRHLCDLAAGGGIGRISYVSATTACEQNRWFPLVDAKMRCEALLGDRGIAHVVFCPTWVMETLGNFVHGSRAAIVVGRNPPPLHFLAARDFGRMVADSYLDERALGRRLFVHGPVAVTLPDALERYLAACHPGIRVIRMSLWQAGLLARLARRPALAEAVRLIDYFDRVGELGDPTEANALLGAPSTTLEAWFGIPSDGALGMPH